VPLEQTQAIYDAATCRKELLLVTPGPEQAALALVLEDWLAGQIDRLAAGKLATTLPAR
jgi:hypothetical protein